MIFLRGEVPLYCVRLLDDYFRWMETLMETSERVRLLDDHFRWMEMLMEMSDRVGSTVGEIASCGARAVQNREPPMRERTRTRTGGSAHPCLAEHIN